MFVPEFPVYHKLTSIQYTILVNEMYVMLRKRRKLQRHALASCFLAGRASLAQRTWPKGLLIDASES